MPEPASSPPPTRASFWETVFASTPVMLAVVSTLLAGQSSTEMSLAQYHRAMAAQQQAKAADQWNFFQAKRIRGTQNEAAADQLYAASSPVPVTSARLRETAALLADAAAKIETDLKPGADLPTAEARKPAGELPVLIGDGKEIDAALARQNPPFAKLKGERFENPDLGIAMLPQRDEAINRVVKAIGERKTEAETLADVAAIPPESLDAAIVVAERNAAAFDAWGRKAAAPVGPVDDWVRRLARSAAGLVRSLEDRREAAEAAGNAGAAELSVPFRRTEAAYRRSQRLLHDLVLARAAFTSWRYSVEAAFNQRSAALYEVEVRRSSWEAGVHMKRSWGYFYGQLAVQAAVTVATLALALRNRSGVWILACVTSLGGLAYAVGVFLNKVPVPGVTEM